MEADTIKQEPLSFITSEAECEDHSNSDLSDLITPKIESKDDDLKIPRSGSWKEEPDDEDIEMASVKQETYSVKAESFPGIKEEEVMIKSEIENSEDSESGNEDDGSEDVPLLRRMELHDTVPAQVLSCDLCDYTTTKKCYLLKHIRVNHRKNNDNKYPCNMCESGRQKGSPVEKQHTCYLCVFKTHIKDGSNKKRKLYYCDRCDFKTYHNKSLRNHLLSLHKTRDKEYTCDICNYKSYLKGNMKAHLLAKHPKGGVIPYACAHCEFKTHYKLSLSRHFVKKHKPDLKIGDPRESNSKNIQDGAQNIDKVT